MYIKAKDSSLRVEIKQLLFLYFRKMIRRNSNYIKYFSWGEIYNESFWLDQLGLFTIKLKKLI